MAPIAGRAARAAALALVADNDDLSAVAAAVAAEAAAGLALAVWAMAARLRLAVAAWLAEEATAAALTAEWASKDDLFDVSISEIVWSLPAPEVRAATCELMASGAAAAWVARTTWAAGEADAEARSRTSIPAGIRASDVASASGRTNCLAFGRSVPADSESVPRRENMIAPLIRVTRSLSL
jgi:hypothetical protein